MAILSINISENLTLLFQRDFHQSHHQATVSVFSKKLPEEVGPPDGLAQRQRHVAKSLSAAASVALEAEEAAREDQGKKGFMGTLASGSTFFFWILRDKHGKTDERG